MNPVVVAPAGASWSNALLIGREVVMSGMTAHPASREATLDCYAQTLVVLGKIQALVEAAGGHIGTIYRLTVYLTDIADKDQVGRARRDFFGGQAVFPTSTLVADTVDAMLAAQEPDEDDQPTGFEEDATA